MKAVITVLGKDAVGILAKISNVCANEGASIIEVTQSVMQDLFAMIMLVDICDLNVGFADFADALEALGNDKGLVIHAMHEDIFNTMHHI